MSVESFASALSAGLKFPFFQAFKLGFITPLNIIPIGYWEIHGYATFEVETVGAQREGRQGIKGSRKMKLGCSIIVYLKGANIVKECRGGEIIQGVYTEDFKKIVEKWTY